MASILVYIEPPGAWAGSAPASPALDALGQARCLASHLGAALYALVPVASSLDADDRARDALVASLSQGGADQILPVPVAGHGEEPATWARQGAALHAAYEWVQPLLVVFPATRAGLELAPRLAARARATFLDQPIIQVHPDAPLPEALPPGSRADVLLASDPRQGGSGHILALGRMQRPVVLTHAARAAACPRGDEHAVLAMLPTANAGPEPNGPHALEYLGSGEDSGPHALQAPGSSSEPGLGCSGPSARILVLIHEPGPDASAALDASAASPASGAASGAPGIWRLDERAQAMLAVGAELCNALGNALTGSLTAVTLTHDRAAGPPWSDAALAAGCDRVVCIDAPAHDELDYLGIAMVLSAAARTLGCDLFLCDERGPAPDHCAIGPAMAELLGITHLTGVIAAAPDAVSAAAPETTAGAMNTAARPCAVIAHQRAGGRIHRFRCPLPAVLCMTAQPPAAGQGAGQEPDPGAARATEPGAERLPQRSAQPAAERLSLRDLGLDPQLLRHRSRHPARPSSRAAASQGCTTASPADPAARPAADPVRH